MLVLKESQSGYNNIKVDFREKNITKNKEGNL